MKKIKRKKRKVYRMIIYIMLFILIPFTIGSVYSYIIQSLKIEGVSSVKETEIIDICRGQVTYEISSWINGVDTQAYRITFTITNNGNKDYNDWDVYIDVPDDVQIISYSSAEIEIIGTKLKASSLYYNSNIQVDSSISFEVQFVTSSKNYEPTNISLNNCYYTLDNESNTNDNLNIEFQFVSMNGVQTYQYNVSVTNVGSDTITNWTFSIKKPNNVEMVNVWDANYIVKNESIEFSSMTYNGTLTPGTSANFGMMISTDVEQYSPELYE